MSVAAPLVFITGASSGIGQALAARFQRAGYRLALVARRANEVARWAKAQGFEGAMTPFCETMAALARLGVTPHIWTIPCEVENPQPLDEKG